MKKYAGVDFNEVKDTAEAKKLADEHHIEYEERHEKGDILNLFFEEYVEGAPDPADVRDGSSDRDLSAHEEEAGEPGLCRAF